jgi:hypothetical protein
MRLSPAQRAHDRNRRTRGQGRRQVVPPFIADEKNDVLPNPILFVDHAKPKARITPIEIPEQDVQRGAICRHLRQAAGVSPKLGRDDNDHTVMSSDPR